MLPKGYLIGNVANDPNIGSSSTWNYARFSVACNVVEKSKGEQGKQSTAHFFDCIAWGKTAEYIGTYIKKGDNVLIDFVLATKSFNNSEGKVIKGVEMRVLNIMSLGKKHKIENTTNDVETSEKTVSSNDGNFDASENITLDDIFSE